MKNLPLHETPGAIPVIAAWYFNEWGHFNAGLQQSAIADSLQASLRDDGLPQALVAMDSNLPMGVSEIKFRELSLYPQLEHWLGGVFVSPVYRGRGVATELVKRSLEVAESHAVTELYLQTQQLGGGMYRRLGWESLEVFEHKGHTKLLMVFRF